MEKLSLKEKLCFCTTKIEAHNMDGTTISHGTGFFFNLQIDESNFAQVIITNKHIACNKKSLTFYLSSKDFSGRPSFTNPIKLTIGSDDLKDCVFEHPDNNVDLCAVAVKPIIDLAKEKGFKPFNMPLINSLIATDEQLEKLDGIEEIYMIGYPNALWDKTHNMPLIRRGITATWPRLDFNGNKEFLIDAACVPGSSGSPVFICDTGLFYDKDKDDMAIGNRFMLLGIQYAVPVKTVDGTIIKKTLDGSEDDIEKNYVAKLQTYLNLGYIIHSSCILDLIPVIKKFVDEQEKES